MDYEGFGIKCIGQSHLNTNTVCQDSVQYIQSLKYTVASVSDGHGGRKYFRSNIGSELAAVTSCEKVAEFLVKSNYIIMNEKEKKAAIEQLIDSVVTEWNIAVREHITHFPFLENEINLVDDKDIEEYKKHTVQKQESVRTKEPYSTIFKAYGATLICVGVNNDFGIGIQIGDGKCVAMYEDCSMDEPIPWDEKCHLNKCTSICDKDAVSEFRVYVWEGKIPMCIYIASDGIDDTFSDRLHSFYRSVTLDLIESEFRNSIKSLEKKLPAITRNGSQDDVSIAGIINVNLARNCKDKIRIALKKEQLVFQLSYEEKELEKYQFKKSNLEKLNCSSTADVRGKELEELIANSKRKIESIKTELGIIKNDDLDQGTPIKPVSELSVDEATIRCNHFSDYADDDFDWNE